MSGEEGGSNKKQPGPSPHTTEVLNQRRKLPYCPLKMAVGGFAFISVVGYLVLYSKKKPEASAVDVAKVAAGVAHPDHTRPRN